MELQRVRLGTAGTPSDVLRALRGDRRPFLLVGGWAGGGAVAGSEPLPAPPGGRSDPPRPAPPGGRSDFPRSGVFRGRSDPGWDPGWVDPGAPGPEPGVLPVGGGWFGVLGFGLGARIERLPPPPPRPVPVPEADVAFYDHVLRMTPDGEWWFEALATDERRAALDARLADLRARLARGGERRPWALRGMAPRAPGHDGHRWAVADTVRRIHEGELFQANITLRLEGELDGEPLDAFADAAPVLRPALGGYLGLAGGRALLSFSPELFLRRVGRTAWTAPIKGTAPRPPDDPEAAESARAALVASAKDAAEHVMIVDLMRNDLGRVATFGTVRAAAAPTVEAHPGLWHLVSTVEAQLRDGATDADLVAATFPPGSVTGAPKVQSLRVINTVEATAREAYTGAIGFLSPVAGLHLNVAIRTFEVADGRVWLGAGGGVVADSDPDAELREALGKARPLVEALGATVAPPPPWRRREVPPLHPRPRPDPAQGVLETARVADGRVEHLDRHLRRLSRAGIDVSELGPRLRDCASRAPAGVHRLRVVARPDGEVEAAIAPAGTPRAPVRLVPVCVPGGLGERKWADRRALEHWVPPEAGLIVDTDGAVLEAAWASVWIAEGGRLLTPPADGRLLPGITRARLLEDGSAAGLQTAEAVIDLRRLRAADAVLLTSSVALVTPVGHPAVPLADAVRAALLSAGSAPSATAAPSAGRDGSPAPGR